MKKKRKEERKTENNKKLKEKKKQEKKNGERERKNLRKTARRLPITYHKLWYLTYDNLSQVITSYDKLGGPVVKFSRTSLFYF